MKDILDKNMLRPSKGDGALNTWHWTLDAEHY